MARLTRAVLLGSLTTIIFAAGIASPAEAQQAGSETGGNPAASPTTDQSGLQDIVVTAQRREERLQDVPVSVSAFTGTDLQAKQISDVVALGRVSAGVQMKTTLAPLDVTTTIRGVSSLISQVSIDPPIGFYVDGVYSGITAGTNTAFVDMERVEVVKGPQGTLFGRNTIGGAISITTHQPTDRFEGYAQGEYGNFNAVTLTGVVNAPIVPGTIDARLVYQYTDHDGYGRNVTLNQDNGTLHQNFVRGTVLAKLGEGWDLTLSGNYTRAYGASQGSRLTYFDPTQSLAPGKLPPSNVFFPAAAGNPTDRLTNYVNKGGWWESQGNLLDTYSLKKYGFSGTLQGSLADDVTVKSITGYSNTDYGVQTDLDGTPYTLLNFRSYETRQNQFSEELQLFGNAFNDRLKWITGAYFFTSDASLVPFAQAFPAAVPPGVPATYSAVGTDDARNRSYAAFIQGTYSLTDTLRLTAGVRYAHDYREIRYNSRNVLASNGAFLNCTLANAPAATSYDTCVYSAKVNYHYFPFTAGLDWKPNDRTLLYVKVSKGYRSGAFPTSGPAFIAGNPSQTQANLDTFAPVEPESLLSPEAGLKIETPNRRLRVNAAIFYSKYNNIQQNILLPAPCATCTPIQSLRNSGAARMYGGELEVTALLGKLRLDGGLGVVDPKYTEGPGVGDSFVNVSKVNWNVGATLPVEMNSGELTFNANYSWRSKVLTYSIPKGSPEVAYDSVTQKGYGLADGRISFKPARLPITFSVFGQNLLNTKYFVSGVYFPPPSSWSVVFPGPPRTFGGSIRYDF